MSAPAPAANAAAEAYLDEAVVDAPAPAAPAGYVRARAPRAAAAPAAATVMASPATAESDFVPAPPASAPPAPSADMAQRKEVAVEGEAKARAEADSARELAAKQSPQLDRIEVSGTRIALADVPVREDARLPIEDWLQRIRERHDGGDLDGARSSLMLFRREHPHHRVPDDLRALPAPEPGTMSATLAGPTSHVLEVKHSRFLVHAAPVTTPEAALAFVAEVGDPAATHNCWAYRIGSEYRFNDDGEPAGTAGRPILAAIDGQGLDQVVAVVDALVRRHQARRRRPGPRLWRQRRRVPARRGPPHADRPCQRDAGVPVRRHRSRARRTRRTRCGETGRTLRCRRRAPAPAPAGIAAGALESAAPRRHT
jgi:hypothetical protein